MSATAIDVERFHLSLNVNDLDKSVTFLTALLGSPPKKHRPDYAKFEPEDLPLVLSLEPRTAPQEPLRSTAGEGPLNHVGIRMTDSAQLVEVQRRLETAGYSTQREDGVACCYARQTKFWVLDDDSTMWEVYVLEEDLEHRGSGGHEDLPVLQDRTVAPCAPTMKPKATWQHRLSEDFPATLPQAGQLDEALLQGSWNARRHLGQWRVQLQQIAQALKPGGKLVLHLLTADQPLENLQPLPGPAGAVQVVPQLDEVLAALAATGFVDAQLVTYSGSPCFTQQGVELRETRIEAFTRPAAGSDRRIRVVYKGPASKVSDDSGNTFLRGVATSIPAASWQRLAASKMAQSFVPLSEPADHATSCGAK
jgi:catechol 2,3-dioxygenase-like lactoylglutathione lyase family enzyme